METLVMPYLFVRKLLIIAVQVMMNRANLSNFAILSNLNIFNAYVTQYNVGDENEQKHKCHNKYKKKKQSKNNFCYTVKFIGPLHWIFY